MLKRLALCLTLTVIGASALASGLPDYPFVHTGGTATTFVVPDVGEIDFEIIITDANPEAAQALMEERMTFVRTMLLEQSIPEGDVDTRNVRKDIRKDGTGYDVKCAVRISVRDLSKWASVVQPLLNLPNMDGFITGFDMSDREKIAAELMVQAIKNARIKAENMALGVGRKLGPASAVTAGQLKNLTTSMGLAASPESYARSQTNRAQSKKDFLMIESQKMAQSVDVIFRLK